MVGPSIDVLHEAFKIAHIYTFFGEKFYRFETVFCIMILEFSPYFICVLCRAKILPQIYTRIIASLKPPPHIRALYARKISPQIYMRIAVRLESAGRLIGRWYLCVCLYHVLYVRSSFEEGRFC